MAKRFIFYLCVAATVLMGAPDAPAQTPADMAALEDGYVHATYADEPTRRFVELYLRLAGGVWITVEWVAAVFLVLGYRRLARWFAQSERPS